MKTDESWNGIDLRRIHIGFVLGVVILSISCKAEVRENVSIVKSEMMTLTTAIELYKLDNPEHPPALLSNLTTPVAYVKIIPKDIFSPSEDVYQYRTDGSVWILFSVGPDKQSDDGKLVYNPTNGTISAGDIILGKMP